MEYAVLATPIGPVQVEADGSGVRAVRLAPGDPAAPDGPGSPAGAAPADGPGPADEPGPVDGPLAAAVTQLREYFAGVRTEFDLPLALPPGCGSEFEQAVWAQLSRIPYGEQRSYGVLAAAVGEPGAARAVGTACHRNPIPVIVPCHRVVGAGGRLVGFGAGLPRKRWLLEHEARVAMELSW